jgi:hypothetical protein
LGRKRQGLLLRDRLARAAERIAGLLPALAKYAQLFNARDWAGLRDLLAEGVELDLIAKTRLKGRADVAHYFNRYQAFEGWRVAPAWLEGREVLAVWTSAASTLPGYFIVLGFEIARWRPAARRGSL